MTAPEFTVEEGLQRELHGLPYPGCEHSAYTSTCERCAAECPLHGGHGCLDAGRFTPGRLFCARAQSYVHGWLGTGRVVLE